MIWIFLSTIVLQKLRLLKKEVLLLKPHNINMVPPTIGRNINNLIKTNDESAAGLFIFAKTDCAVCQPEIEVFINLNLRYGKVPVTLVLLEEDIGVTSYFEKYKDRLKIKTTSSEKINKYIYAYPSILLTDDRGIIVQDIATAKIAYNIYKDYILSNTPSENIS